ncbi:OmpP1/FadL family transporter, partial [Thermodesulfobacteriota bacterium]
TRSFGEASGTMTAVLGGAYGAGITNIDWARFDFSNSSDFTGEARGYGAAGKIGVVYKVTPDLTIGATYHSRTALEDLETDDATLSMQIDTPGPTDLVVPVTGRMEVKDFEWPETYGIGFAYQVTDRFMIAADVKQIMWSNVMEDFKMTFTADSSQADPNASGFGLGGTVMNATLYQDWDDQTVVSVGFAVKATDMITLRAGYNHSTNPVPDMYLNYLFPAIVEEHITAGLGFDFSESSSLNLAMSYAPEVTAIAGIGVTSDHSQISAQMMYTFRY